MLNIDDNIPNNYTIINPSNNNQPYHQHQQHQHQQQHQQIPSSYNTNTSSAHLTLHKYPIMSTNNISSPNGWNNGYFINTNQSNNDQFDSTIPPHILDQQSQSSNSNSISNTPIDSSNQLTLINDQNYLALTKPQSQQQQQQPPTSSSLSNTSSKKPKHTKSKPAFVMKLWTMVNDPNNHDLINWFHDGLSFLVTNRELFVQKILPKYFKHSNFASFVRQLNMYGWHKVQDANSGSLHSDEKWQFINPNFQKDKPELLDKIVRNKPNDSDQSDQHQQQHGQGNHLNNGGGGLPPQFDVNILINELNTLKTNQMKITQELSRVRSDNELLWKELFNTREKNLLQNEKIEKILHFLASVYGNKVKVLEDHMNYNNHQLLQNQASFDQFQQNQNQQGQQQQQQQHGQHNQTSTSSLNQNLNISEPSSSIIDNNYPDDLISSPRFNKPRLMIKQTRHVSNPSNSSTPNTTQDSPIQEIIRSPGNLSNYPSSQSQLHQQQHHQQQQQSSSTPQFTPQSPFPFQQSYNSHYLPSDDFQQISNQQGPSLSSSQQQQESNHSRPSMTPQPSFEDLSKTIEQQGQSINEIISRIQQNQPQQFPFDQQQQSSQQSSSQQQTVQTPNLPPSFDLDEFLNQDLLPDDNEANLGQDDQKVGTIREIFDDVDDQGQGQGQGQSQGQGQDSSAQGGKHKDDDEEEIEEIINPSKKRKSGGKY